MKCEIKVERENNQSVSRHVADRYRSYNELSCCSTFKIQKVSCFRACSQDFYRVVCGQIFIPEW